MIVFNNVTKEYKNHSLTNALDDVTFEIKEGEFVFIVGPSGSGKSTIVRLLVREEVPTSGTIFFNDVEITKLKKKGLPVLRREIGVVFQDYKLLPHKTVFENVAFLLEVSGKKDDEIKKTTNSILDLVGLIERTNNFPPQLAGGEMQRVAIARALANDPQLLIADEPTGNLDPANAWDVIQLLNKVNSWGTTVIMATHDKDVVDSMKKRVIELEHGKIIRDEGKGVYFDKENVKEMTDEPAIEIEIEEIKDSSKVTKTDNVLESEANLDGKHPEQTNSMASGQAKHAVPADGQNQGITTVDEENIEKVGEKQTDTVLESEVGSDNVHPGQARSTILNWYRSGVAGLGRVKRTVIAAIRPRPINQTRKVEAYQLEGMDNKQDLRTIKRKKLKRTRRKSRNSK